jgi:hypothetical protein
MNEVIEVNKEGKQKRLARLELQTEFIHKLSEIVRYVPSTGEFFNVKNNRKIFPDYDGQYRFWFGKERKRLNIKMEKAALYLGAGIAVTEQQKIIFKNLDERDYRLNNLVIVPKEEYKEINEALTNLVHYLKIKPHHSDQFSYFVFYREGKITKRVFCQDIISANDLHRELKLKYLKLITKYCNTDI